MKKIFATAIALGVFVAGQATFAAATPIFKAAKALKVTGEVMVRANEKDVAVAMKEGDSYPAGTIITTGRASFVDMEFSPKNTFRIMAGSTVTVQPNTKNPKLVALKLKEGEVESNLGNFPKGCHYEVQTPLAICGAVGTIFKVKYVFVGKNGVSLEVTDSEGNVTVRNESGFKVEGNGLRAGQSLSVTLTKGSSGWKANVTFTGAPGSRIMVNLWGIRQEIVILEGATTTGTGTATATASTSVEIQLPPYLDPTLSPLLIQIVTPEDGGNDGAWKPFQPLPPPPLGDVPISSGAQ